jgi:hypothetical protein
LLVSFLYASHVDNFQCRRLSEFFKASLLGLPGGAANTAEAEAVVRRTSTFSLASHFLIQI